MLRGMCQTLSERKRPVLADWGAGFNRPCWALKSSSAARDRVPAGPARPGLLNENLWPGQVGWMESEITCLVQISG